MVDESQKAIRVHNLSFSYGGEPVLVDVDFEVVRGTTLAVLGMSGCGKTTLLRCLDGLAKPSSGTIEICQSNLAELTHAELNKLRLNVGYVFQAAALFDSLTILENVIFPLTQHLRLPHSELVKRARMQLERVGLTGVDNKYPSELSGGMRKRAAIARALVLEPKVMLYDEPSAGLDPIIGARISDLIDDLKHHLGVTSVVVTHYVSTALKLADQLMLLHEGVSRFLGSPEEIRNSQDPLVQQFLGSTLHAASAGTGKTGEYL